MNNESATLYYLFLFFWAAMSILPFSSPVMSSQTKKQDSMVKTTITIPPIDQAAPVAYQAATFGLG